MDEGNLGFAEDMKKAFGDDRFYHALNRAAEGDPLKVRPFYVALTNGGNGWAGLCNQIKLRFKGNHFSSINLGADGRCPKMDDDQYVRELLCRAAFVISSDHKHFALRRGELPPNIHARMILDTQNEWTRKYADNLDSKEKENDPRNAQG